jgi:hypothetical protein
MVRSEGKFPERWKGGRGMRTQRNLPKFPLVVEGQGRPRWTGMSTLSGECGAFEGFYRGENSAFSYVLLFANSVFYW